jgi:MSHA pilin protein MshA
MMHYNKKAQQGFTLIELVIVIVITGILAITAVPKFIDLTSEAKKSVIEGVEGALNSAADMAHAKALVSNTVGGTISVAGQSITFVNGWPASESINDLMDIDTTADADISVSAPAGTGSVATYSYKGSTTCTVTYTETNNKNEKPAIVSTTSDC